MRSVIGLILLAFPFAEIFLLVELAHRYGWWLLVYLVVIGCLGLQLIRGEKLLMSAKMMQSLSAGGNPVKTMLGSARNMVAGVLLIIPGVITDMIAVILLLIPFGKPNASSNFQNHATNTQYDGTYNSNPSNSNPSNSNPNNPSPNKPSPRAANDDVIEGEFVEIKEDPDKNR